MHLKSLFALPLVLCVTVLASGACSGTAPKQIAAYPADAPAPTPIAREPAPGRPGEAIVYGAELTLEVADVDAAAERASNLAYDHAGYPVSAQSWYREERKYTTLVLAAPMARFDSLRSKLLDLGVLVIERMASETATAGDEWARYAHITLQLRPAPPTLTLIAPNGWSPARTFERAFRVIASIFQVVADVLIWVVVVIWLATRQLRRQSKL